MFDVHARTFDALQKKKPVSEVRIHKNVQVCELNQKRRMSNPRNGDFAGFQFRKNRFLMLAGAANEQRLPNHFVKERARIEMLGGRKVLERFGKWPPFRTIDFLLLL